MKKKNSSCRIGGKKKKKYDLPSTNREARRRTLPPQTVKLAETEDGELLIYIQQNHLFFNFISILWSYGLVNR